MFNVIKILYLILFYLIYRITDLILLLVMLVQTILNIFSGEPSDSIKVFGKSLGVYLQQISEFLSYASEEKPFPFSDWPVFMLSDLEELSDDPEKPRFKKRTTTEELEQTGIASTNNDSNTSEAEPKS